MLWHSQGGSAKPPLVRFYIRHVLTGFALAAVFTGLLLWLNVGNLWHLVTRAAEGPLAAFVLFFLNGIVFAEVQHGIAVMRLSEDDDKDDRAPPVAADPVAVPVRMHNGR
jgi:hypothetical protein